MCIMLHQHLCNVRSWEFIWFGIWGFVSGEEEEEEGGKSRQGSTEDQFGQVPKREHFVDMDELNRNFVPYPLDPSTHWPLTVVY